MIAENKAEFFDQLRLELEKLGVEDTGELMGDLEEHFAEGERRGVPESETCRELGSIAEIARSCLDIKSTAINSMVARDVERKKGVSLTKPGHDTPADPSLAAPGQELPSYTPEHHSEEIYPNAAQNNSAGSFGSGVGEGYSPGAGENGSSGAGESGTAEVGADSAGESGGAEAGTFEKVGKAVDAAMDKAGKALNDALNKAGTAVGAFRPSDSYREHVNTGKNGGDIPPQYTKTKTGGGGSFVDTSGLKPNVNAGRLLVEIILDFFLWIWLVPLAFSLVIAVFGLSLGLIGAGLACFFGQSVFAQYKLITRVLFGLGFLNGSAAAVCLAVAMFRLPIGLLKKIISRHVKAIYDI